MKKGKNKITSLFIGSVLLLGLSACGEENAVSGKASEDGVRTVKVGGLFDITGGTGDVGTPYAEGEKAYFKYLDSIGGIEGLNIEIDGKDYAYAIPEAQKIYQELRDKEKVSAVLGWGTGDTEALRQQVANDKLPFVSASYSESLKNLEESPYNFLVAASYSDQGRAILQWIKENHKGENPTITNKRH